MKKFPWQNKWVCQHCGRMFTIEQVRKTTDPTCFFCGTEHKLKPWMDKPWWQFFVFGLIGLPAIGNLICRLAIYFNFHTVDETSYCFFLFPLFLTISNVPSYLLGRFQGNRMLEEGGKQGLLMVLGFAIAYFLLKALKIDMQFY